MLPTSGLPHLPRGNSEHHLLGVTLGPDRLSCSGVLLRPTLSEMESMTAGSWANTPAGRAIMSCATHACMPMVGIREAIIIIVDGMREWSVRLVGLRLAVNGHHLDSLALPTCLRACAPMAGRGAGT